MGRMIDTVAKLGETPFADGREKVCPSVQFCALWLTGRYGSPESEYQVLLQKILMNTFVLVGALLRVKVKVKVANYSTQRVVGGSGISDGRSRKTKGKLRVVD